MFEGTWLVLHECVLYIETVYHEIVRHPRKLSNIIFEGKKRLVCICSHVGWICNIVSKFLRLWSTSVKLFVSSTRTCPRLCSWAWNSFLVSPKRHSSNCRLDRSIVQMERDRLKSCFNTIPRFQRYLSPMEREFFIWDCNLINLFTWFVLRVWIEKKQTNKNKADGRRLAVGYENGTLILWSRDGCRLFERRKHTANIGSIRWNPIQLNIFASGSNDRVLYHKSLGNNGSLARDISWMRTVMRLFHYLPCCLFIFLNSPPWCGMLTRNLRLSFNDS